MPDTKFKDRETLVVCHNEASCRDRLVDCVRAMYVGEEIMHVNMELSPEANTQAHFHNMIFLVGEGQPIGATQSQRR